MEEMDTKDLPLGRALMIDDEYIYIYIDDIYIYIYLPCGCGVWGKLRINPTLILLRVVEGD